MRIDSLTTLTTETLFNSNNKGWRTRLHYLQNKSWRLSHHLQIVCWRHSFKKANYFCFVVVSLDTIISLSQLKCIWLLFAKCRYQINVLNGLMVVYSFLQETSDWIWDVIFGDRKCILYGFKVFLYEKDLRASVFSVVVHLKSEIYSFSQWYKACNYYMTEASFCPGNKSFVIN